MSHCRNIASHITGSPLTVYNCWRPRESLSASTQTKPRDKQQHADEESSAGVRVFRAQSRLTKKPAQSATTCFDTVYFGSWSSSGAGDDSATGRRAPEGSQTETEPHHNLLRGSRAGPSPRPQRASWRNIPAQSARARGRGGEEGGGAEGLAQRDGQKHCADTSFTPTPGSGCDFANLQGEM